VYAFLVSKCNPLKKIRKLILKSELFKRTVYAYCRFVGNFGAQKKRDVSLPNNIKDNRKIKYFGYKLYNSLREIAKERSLFFLDTNRIDWDDFHEYWYALNNLNNLCKKQSIRLILLTTPVISDFSDYKYILLHNYVHELAQELNIEILDTLNNFSSLDYRDIMVQKGDVSHFNALGHEITAEAIFEYLNK